MRGAGPIGICALALGFVICVANGAFAQECPPAGSAGPNSASRVRTLEGRLVYHDGIRKWFELELDKPQCGQRSVQLTKIGKEPVPLEVFRDCRVRSSGPIEVSATGYYSLGTFQGVQEIEPIGACSRQSPFPDYSAAKPDKLIRAYSVDMQVNYRRGDHPIVFHAWHAGMELRPRQAYASYWLTGSFVLYGHCGEGFAVDKVFGPPQAKPMHFDDWGAPDDMAAFDPDNAAHFGKWDLHLGYTCIREPLHEN
jgi:hypothetical protein